MYASTPTPPMMSPTVSSARARHLAHVPELEEADRRDGDDGHVRAVAERSTARAPSTK